MGRGDRGGARPLSPRNGDNRIPSARSNGSGNGNRIPSARSNGSGNGHSVWREVVTHLEADYRTAPVTIGEPDVSLSLSMVSQLKEELAIEMRKVVREELWRPFPAAQGQPQMSVGQLGVMGFNETVKRQGPPGGCVPAQPPRVCVSEEHDSLDNPQRTLVGMDMRPKPRVVGAQAGGAAEVAPSVESTGDDQSMDLEDERWEVMKRLSEGIRLFETGDNYSAAAEVWATMVSKCPCCSPCLLGIRHAYNRLGNAEAPPRSDPLSKFADGHIFGTLVNFLILLNSVFMIYAADMEIANYDGEVPDLVDIGEMFFFVAYSCEFVVKIWRYHVYYFVDRNWKYNCIDFFLLILSAWSIFFEDKLPNLSWLRMLRMLRLFKIARVLKLISIVKPLRAILKSLFETMGTLFWSLTLLALILALFALVFVLRVATFLSGEGDSLDEDVVSDLLGAYGSVEITFMHLFEATTGGNDWIIFYEPLEVTGIINCGIFYFFVAFTQIAVLNIILGVFVDTAMKSMIGDKEEKMQEFVESQRQMRCDLTELCNEADLDQDGKLSETEWQTAMSNDKLLNYLDLMEWRPSEVRDFLTLMCRNTGDGAIEIDVFVRACMRFKGSASCYDMQTVLNAVEDLRRHIRTAMRDGGWRDPVPRRPSRNSIPVMPPVRVGYGDALAAPDLSRGLVSGVDA